MWDELIKTTLLGTERTDSPDSLDDLLKAFKLPQAPSSEEALLQLLSVYGAAKKTAVINSKVKFEKLETHLDDNACGPAATKSLKVILKGMHAPALKEFLELLEQYQQVLPPSMLPELFEESKSNKKLWKDIKHLIGQRGEWLLSQNVDWMHLGNQIVEVDWKFASKEVRLLLLKHWRKTAPQKATKALASTWSEEDYKSKVEFLKTLAIGLSKKDEPFLKKGLSESRKEIRKIAGELLLKIPDSEYSNQLFELLKKYILLKKVNIQVELPEEIDERYGAVIHFDKKKSLTKGMKTVILGQLFSKIPLEKWEAYFEFEPKELVPMFLKCNEKHVMAEHLINACFEQKNEKWIAPLLHYWLQEKSNLNFMSWQIQELVPLLSDKTFNLLAMASLPKEPQLLGELVPLFIYLKNSTQHWDDDLSEKIINPLKEHISKLQSFNWSTWHYKELLKTAAYRVNPSLLQRGLGDEWNLGNSGQEMWQPEIEQFLGGLKFRRKMYLGFTKV